MPANIALWLLLLLQHDCPEILPDHSRPGIASSQVRSSVVSPLHTVAQLQLFATPNGIHDSAGMYDCSLSHLQPHIRSIPAGIGRSSAWQFCCWQLLPPINGKFLAFC